LGVVRALRRWPIPIATTAAHTAMVLLAIHTGANIKDPSFATSFLSIVIHFADLPVVVLLTALPDEALRALPDPGLVSIVLGTIQWFLIGVALQYGVNKGRGRRRSTPGDSFPASNPRGKPRRRPGPTWA